jgi:hypothetical protein
LDSRIRGTTPVHGVKVAAVTSGREGKKNEQIHLSLSFGRILTIPIMRNIPLKKFKGYWNL